MLIFDVEAYAGNTSKRRQFQGILRLRGGDLYVGCCPLDESKTVAVLGGTGEFVAVTGQFSQRFTSADTGSWTIELQRRREP